MHLCIASQAFKATLSYLPLAGPATARPVVQFVIRIENLEVETLESGFTCCLDAVLWFLELAWPGRH
jgi:hypothetical protein